MKHQRPKCHGATANQVLHRLIDALQSKYPGIGISNDDFWFQKGDYIKSTWDLARWGAEIQYKQGIRIQLYSWDTMRQCAKGLTLLVHPQERLPHHDMSKLDPTQNRLKIGTISHGTLRAEDLIPRFLSALSEVAPEQAAELAAEKPDESDEIGLDFWINNTLWDALNDHCPADYYFGAHPGDGADFGVWPIDSNEED